MRKKDFDKKVELDGWTHEEWPTGVPGVHQSVYTNPNGDIMTAVCYAYPDKYVAKVIYRDNDKKHETEAYTEECAYHFLHSCIYEPDFIGFNDDKTGFTFEEEKIIKAQITTIKDLNIDISNERDHDMVKRSVSNMMSRYGVAPERLDDIMDAVKKGSSQTDIFLIKDLETVYQEVVKHIEGSGKNLDMAYFKTNYRKYLNEKYDHIIDSLYEQNPTKLGVYIPNLIKEEKKMIDNRDPDGIFAFIVKDENYDELLRESKAIFEKAKNKEKIDNRECKELMDKVEYLCDHVLPFNKDRAENLLSETILDIDYCCNPADCKCFSFRLARKLGMYDGCIFSEWEFE